jgi:hypothetical protein
MRTFLRQKQAKIQGNWLIVSPARRAHLMRNPSAETRFRKNANANAAARRSR